VNGARVGITAARRADEQAALVRSMGGVPVHGPALRPDEPLADHEVLPDLDRALSAPLDHAIFLTGVGADLTVQLAARGGREGALRAALSAARVTVRGPKPRRALRALGIRVDEVVDPAENGAVRDVVLTGSLEGRRVLVQGYGAPELIRPVVEPLRRAGAEPIVVVPYAGRWPADPRPAQSLARAAAGGALDALTFTSALAATQFLALAEAAGVEPADLRRRGVLIASVGPVTRRALEDAGLEVDVEPEPPRMGALYRALARAIGTGRTNGCLRISVRATEGVARTSA
jgi:uroporphyrinogen-III synthase